MRRGATLLELVTVLTLIGLLSAMAAPRVGDALDRLAVRKAVGEAAMFYGAARFGAILQGSRVRIEFGPDSMIAVYERANDSLFLRRDGPAKDGVNLRASRRVIRILPNGLGSGGSNTTLVFRRGVHAESLTTSRLGRLKRWR
ncbi:MAG: prepilin-type N-terminal cleavage/methylation domain-containing protein [Gemmatimonadetes bacterium]|nr:prepilin-type N-terminal cleavage/methylation domain-containing protein [Gemmatimonadota bacterium]